MYRILILGDFAARDERAAAGEPATSITARRVDRDDLDEAIAAFAPEVHVALDPSGDPVRIRFAALDDFHPDRLLERLPVFRQLIELRDQSAAPARQAPASPTHRAPDSSRAAKAALNLGGGSLLDRIVDSQGDPGAAGSVEGVHTAPDELSDFVRRAVEPHRVAESTAEQRQIVAKVNDVISAMLRVMLHHPRFQAAESLWRGVDLLTRRLETGEDLEIHLAGVARADLVAALSDDKSAAAAELRRLLVKGWDLVVAHHTFGPDDVSLLGRAAALARETGAPWITGGAPGLAGAESFGDNTDSDDWSSAPVAGWDALRRTPEASWLSVALPRVLVRAAYGKATEPCESMAFEEIADGPVSHDSHLWGNPGIIYALLAGLSAVDGDDPPTQGTVDNLPFQYVNIDGSPTAVPCAEALLSQRSVSYLLDRGLTPLASEKDGDAVRLPRIQSAAHPAAALARALRR